MIIYLFIGVLIALTVLTVFIRYQYDPAGL